MEQLRFPLPDQQTPRSQSLSRNREAINSIKGFRYKEDYIDEWEQDQLLRQIDEQQWLSDLKRRVQHSICPAEGQMSNQTEALYYEQVARFLSSSCGVRN